MKHLLLFASAVLALPELARRGGKQIINKPAHPDRKAFLQRGAIGMQITSPEKVLFTPEKPRPDSPDRPEDTRASGKVTGQGHIQTARSKNRPMQDSQLVMQGNIIEKKTHDREWSLASVTTIGNPVSQSHRMHPTKAESQGQSGKIKVVAPRGGYGTIKKEVNGIATDQRVRGGEYREDSHIGSMPNEVKFTGTASRGGAVDTVVTNDRTLGPDITRTE